MVIIPRIAMIILFMIGTYNAYYERAETCPAEKRWVLVAASILSYMFIMLLLVWGGFFGG